MVGSRFVKCLLRYSTIIIYNYWLVKNQSYENVIGVGQIALS